MPVTLPSKIGYVQSSDFSTLLKQDIHIIASGPSIRTANLAYLEKQACIFVNGSISLTEQYHFSHILGYVISDKRFIEHNLDLFRQHYRGQPLFITEPVWQALQHACPKYIEPYLGHIKLLRNASPRTPNLWQRCLNTVFQRSETSNTDIVISPKHNTHRKPIAVSLNIATGYVEAGTVAYIAAQLAFSMGTTRIHLHGVDLINTREPRFYEKPDHQAPCMLDKAVANRIVPSFDWLAEVYRQHGVEIVNHSGISNNLFHLIPWHECLTK